MVAVSPQRPPTPPGDATGEPDDAALAVGLALELDALRRQVEPLTGVVDRVDELAGVVTDLATKVATLSGRKGPTPCPSWLLAPTDPDTVGMVLHGLRGWLDAVYLRYTDAAAGLPECWCWHPDIVEELVWLMHAWLAAYQGPAASVGLVADWHDRYRPGVVRRVKLVGGSCSRERHQTRPGRDRPAGAPTAPAGEAATAIAQWWALHRDQPAPEPADRPVPTRPTDGRWEVPRP